MPALPRNSPKYKPATDNQAYMLEQQRGHRAYPRYPDGRDFELDSDLETGCRPSRHDSEINNDIYEEYG